MKLTAMLITTAMLAAGVAGCADFMKTPEQVEQERFDSTLDEVGAPEGMENEVDIQQMEHR